jgi:hypothetical protein
MQCGVMRTAGHGYCANCGKNHDPAADFCTGCGASVSAQGRFSSAGSGAATVSAVADSAFSFNVQAPGNAIPEELTRRWSWGAFLLHYLWPLWNANVALKWITLAAFILSIFTAGLPGLALAIYLGINGNRIAARDRRFSSTEEYVAVQHAWAKAGVLLLVIGIPLVMMLSLCAAIVTAIGSH